MKGLRLLASAVGLVATLGWCGAVSGADDRESEIEDPPPVQCGVPLTSVLSRETVDSHSFEGSAGDAVALGAIDVTGNLGLLRMRLLDPEDHLLAETCSGSIQQVLPQEGTYRIDVSDCVPEGAGAAGNYTLTLNAISTTLGDQPNCGIPIACTPGIYTGSLQDPNQESLFGAVAGQRFMLSAPAIVSIGALDPSGHGVLKLRLFDPHGRLLAETCEGEIDTSVGLGVYTVLVNDCSGADIQNYALSFKVVSQGPDNCGVPLQCGAPPVVMNLGVPGEVDAYNFTGTAGARVTINTTDITGSIGGLSLRIFDPDGVPLAGAGACVSSVRNAQLPKTGTYTALVSACDRPTTGQYGINYQAPACPTGPDISYLGIARADSTLVPRAGYDDSGRPVYVLQGGSGFFVVIEGQPGTSHAPVGPEAFNYDPQNASVLPDLQVLLSRPLGNGSRAVCDKPPAGVGGVPSTPALEFPEALPAASRPAVAASINDFGCLVNDGTGEPLGVSAANACTVFADGESHFVNPSSTLQFCTPIALDWSFRRGPTIVEARTRDRLGFVGAPREMVVRVEKPNYCDGDCNEDNKVTIDEVLLAQNIALGTVQAGDCSAADINEDGQVTIDEILVAVNVTLTGCPAS